MELLKFTKGNAKLSKTTLIFDVPSGFTCKFAVDCFTKVDRITGKITDGKNAKFRCYAATTENFWKRVRAMRWHNFDLLKKCKEVFQFEHLILTSLTQNKKFNISKVTHVRVHSAGDFYTKNYFLAWMRVARIFPTIVFYAYTKSIPFWIENKEQIPENFILTASFGGKFDNLILENNLKSCSVAFSEEHAKEMNLPIDHEDTYPQIPNQSFCILLHGTQPAGSQASVSMNKMRKKGINGYQRKNISFKNKEEK